MCDVVRSIDKAAGQRWRSLDRLLPVPDDLAEGCSRPFLATGQDGQDGYAICRHRRLPDSSLEQAWGAKRRYVLTPRLAGPDTFPALDSLLTQWRDHLAGFTQPGDDDAAALLTWPAREVTGVRALLKHGLVPKTVIAARPHAAQAAAILAGGRLTIRTATADDADAATAMELAVMAYDAQFGCATKRPATAALMRDDVRAYLARQAAAPWTWLAVAGAGRDSRAVGLLTVQPPDEARWIAGYTSLAPAAYLSTLYVAPEYRGKGLGGAMVRHAHDALDERDIAITLLHHAQVNPLSGPFWYRMGYRPLWTTWEARPAAALR